MGMAQNIAILGALWITCAIFGVTIAIERHYFIAAVEVIWDYAPSGQNLVGLNNK